MKTFALVLALAFAAPLVASAATATNANSTVAQKVAATYHTTFSSNGQ